jgi:hypothetical protein
MLSRTLETDLTDDELILFDIMFDGGTSFRLLRREGFEQQWNRRSHNLTDAELLETLEKLVKLDYLRTESDQGVEYFKLTSIGGYVWERERVPAWDRYATDRYGQTKSGRPVVKILATTQQSRDDFWQIGREVGFFAYANGRTKQAVIRNHRLIPWKSFSSLYVWIAVLDGWHSLTDWGAFENRRTWWRSPEENEKFRTESV